MSTLVFSSKEGQGANRGVPYPQPLTNRQHSGAFTNDSASIATNVKALTVPILRLAAAAPAAAAATMPPLPPPPPLLLPLPLPPLLSLLPLLLVAGWCQRHSSGGCAHRHEADCHQVRLRAFACHCRVGNAQLLVVHKQGSWSPILHPLHTPHVNTHTAAHRQTDTHTRMCQHTHPLDTPSNSRIADSGMQEVCKAASRRLSPCCLVSCCPIPAHLRRVEERAMGSGTRVAEMPVLPPALTPEPASATAGRLLPLTPSSMAPTAATTMRGSSTAATGGGGYSGSSSVLAPVTAGRASNMRTIPEGEPRCVMVSGFLPAYV